MLQLTTFVIIFNISGFTWMMLVLSKVSYLRRSLPRRRFSTLASMGIWGLGWPGCMGAWAGVMNRLFAYCIRCSCLYMYCWDGSKVFVFFCMLTKTCFLLKGWGMMHWPCIPLQVIIHGWKPYSLQLPQSTNDHHNFKCDIGTNQDVNRRKLISRVIYISRNVALRGKIHYLLMSSLTDILWDINML